MAAGGPVAIGKEEGRVREHGGQYGMTRMPSDDGSASESGSGPGADGAAPRTGPRGSRSGWTEPDRRFAAARATLGCGWGDARLGWGDFRAAAGPTLGCGCGCGRAGSALRAGRLRAAAGPTRCCGRGDSALRAGPLLAATGSTMSSSDRAAHVPSRRTRSCSGRAGPRSLRVSRPIPRPGGPDSSRSGRAESGGGWAGGRGPGAGCGGAGVRGGATGGPVRVTAPR